MGGEDGEGSASGSSSPALQVIVLGAGGGPHEHNVTALLVRSIKAGWTRGSIVAVDAGVHLSAITRILEANQVPAREDDEEVKPYTIPSGPFEGLEVTSTTATANAAYVTRHLIDTYLITHPHLDHISGFVINTAGLPGTRPKRLAGLPSTISAVKTHIFNNVIWPNLSDENNGAGLVTFMRLVEGGSSVIGDGDGRGYLEISDGLTVKVCSVSHGHCVERHSHRGSTSSSRYGSGDVSMMSPRAVPGSSTTASQASGPSQLFRSGTMSYSGPSQERDTICVYDSSAYFIRDDFTGREVLIFGDVEPDSISLSPRNLGIWQEAAPRIASGNLAAIFIECSYDDSRTTERLFGHLAPRFIIEEMKALGNEVDSARRNHNKNEMNKKRKRDLEEASRRSNRAAARSTGDDGPVSPKTVRPKFGSGSEPGGDTPGISTPTMELSLKDFDATSVPHMSLPQPFPLRGLTVVIIHVKDNLTDGETAGQTILRELLEHEKEAELGCEFVISSDGQSFKF